MPTSVSCILPEPVTQLLSKEYDTRPYAVLLRAVKLYTNTHSSIDASAAAAKLAVERGCTKTDIYRAALIQFDDRVAEAWPAPGHSPRVVARAHRIMDANPNQPTAHERKLQAVAQTLTKLRDRAPNMRTHQIVSVINQILDRLPKE